MGVHIGKMLMITGIVIFTIGGIFYLFKFLPSFGNLPGDVTIRKNNFVIYFPLATSILISVILTIVLNLILRRR